MKKWLLTLLCFVTVNLFAEDFPERPQPPKLVNDMAGMLDAGQVQALEQKLVSFNDSTSTQIAIVTLTSIGGYAAGDYAFRLAEKWGIGQKGKNNGILILVAKESRDVFIATGYGMEEFVPDALAKRIVELTIKPQFKEGRFYDGLNEATTQVMGLVQGKFTAEDLPKQKQEKGGTPPAFIVIIIILFVIMSLIKRGGGRGGPGSRTIFGHRNYGGWGSFSSGGGIFGGGGGGGGFGGFGGGSFGGGGAGGKW
jgi:uncharacterized protein